MFEKGIAFTEEKVFPSQEEALLKRSPLGKIPFIETEQGCLSESHVILEYLEDAYPEKPIYPAVGFGRAKCQEVIQHLELNVELQVRRLYKEALFGGNVSDETKNEVKERLDIGLKVVARLAKFSPYFVGEIYTVADCVAWLHFFMVSTVSQKIYGADMLTAHPLIKAGYSHSLVELAKAINPIIQGWINYYGKFRKSAMSAIYSYINEKLLNWARRKFKSLQRRKWRASQWLKELYRQYPTLFAHWRVWSWVAG